MTLVAVLIVAASVHWAIRKIVAEVRAARNDATCARAVALMQLFAPGIETSARDPRALVVWQPLAKAARQMFPAEFAALDRASGGVFPFTTDQIQAAHAAWTADWLAWERAHDADYKLKAAALEHALPDAKDAALLRARLDASEREKLDLYQRRYQEYVRVAKALEALTRDQS